ncbi:hypothetical protein ACS0TY_000017 [Phlomoides rotata]
MITENPSLFSSFIILLISLVQTSLAITNPSPYCSPSACANIRNISFPFRLKDDPQHCGHPYFELSCENNVTTILDLNSQKYQVKAINYVNQTIWLTDVSVIDNTCSFPNVSLYRHILNNPYDTWRYNFTSQVNTFVDVAWPISLMRCPYPLKNSSLFTELPAPCAPSPTHTYYIKVGHMNFTDVGDNCSVDLIVLTSWNFKDVNNISLSEIHHSLLYGFQLTWPLLSCRLCNGRWQCSVGNGCSHFHDNLWGRIKYPIHGPEGSGLLSAAVIILLLILVVVFAGVNLPAMIILGISCASAFYIIQMRQYINLLNVYWPVHHFPLIFGIFLAVRFIILLPYMMWFLINKFRTRHLSRYDEIEVFLQSDNKLMPIRYTYSDIKKMTKGFREKLGQGGYGTVYKGKLRSGYDVAVKLLGKSGGGNGQDFMNEIATIGRIHHVNVVNLVGYCAERSKRALVFDFMPNGSLDKHIFDREKGNCLSWERKYEIAVGVARGIEYLHTGCDIQILHFDIKPHNILLDHNFTPKITDFGLAKFFSTDKKVVTMTAVRGTIGYVAPELINRGIGRVSYKADVYSFGMLLMEMVSLNKDLESNNQASSQYFPCWIYDCFEKGQDVDVGITDKNNNDEDNDTNRKIAKKMTIVALWCIQMCPDDRPSMHKVVEMLEAPVERLRVPNRSSQSAQVAVNYEDQSWTTYATDSTSLIDNDVAPSIDITVVD